MTMYAYNTMTLAELAKRIAPDRSLNPIVDALMEENDVLKDMIFKEANDTFSHKTTRWSAEPSGSWRKLNEGVSTEVGKTTVLVDTVAILETRSEIDKRLIDAFPNPKQARSDEAMAFVRGLAKTVAEGAIYGNSATTPEQFTGFAPRVNAATDDMVIDAGGSGSGCTSIYVCDWSPDKLHMLYGKNGKAGLQHEDLGVDDVLDDSSKKFRAYVDLFTWEVGMVLRNQRALGRICSIETTGTSNIFNEDDLIDILEELTQGGRRRIYVNRTIRKQMRKRLKDKNNVNFTRDEGLDGGGPRLAFDGIPISRVDQIVNTETAL